MDVYRLSERSQGSGPRHNRRRAGPNDHCLGAHGQFPIVAGLALIIAIAALSLTLFTMPAENVTKIVAGDNIDISPDNGYGSVTIASTGVGANGAASENNVTRVIAGENVTISPENGYGDVTITAAGDNNGNGVMGENNVTRIIAGENIDISPDNGYGDVTITADVLIDDIRPSQLDEPPQPDEDGRVPSYNVLDDTFVWIEPPTYGWQLIADYTAPFDVTRVTFSNLNMETDGPYHLIILDKTGDPSGWSGDHFRYLFFNGDETNSNYWRQHFSLDGTTFTGSRANDSILIFPFGNGYGMTDVLMGKLEGGMPFAISRSIPVMSGTTIKRFEEYIIRDNVANVTSITIKSGGVDKIEAGARFMLLRVT